MSYMPRSSWFGSKTSSVPAHSGSEPVQNFYNPVGSELATHQQPVWNNSTQQEPYWHGTSNPPPVPKQNDGNMQSVGGINAWDWGAHTPNQTQYQQHTSFHTTTDQNYYGNTNSQSTMLSSINDPWNWRVDDSSSNDGGTNNNVEASDAAWNWSVENTAYQQQPSIFTDTSNYQPPQLSMFTDATNTTYHQQPIMHTATSSSAYYQQPNAYLTREDMPSKDQLDEAFAATPKSMTSNVDNVLKSFPTEQKHSSEFFNKTEETSGTTTTHIDQLEPSYTYEDRKSVVTPQQQCMTPVSTAAPVEVDSNDSKKVMASSTSSIEGAVDDSFSARLRAIFPGETATSEEDLNAQYASDPSIVSEVSQSDTYFRTDQVANKLSISSVMHHNRQLLIADGLVIGDQLDREYSLSSKHGSSGLTPQWSTESLPSQGSDEVSHTMEGSRSDVMPSPLSPVSQSPCLPEIQGFEHNQCDNGGDFSAKPFPVTDNGLTVESLGIGKLGSSGEVEENFLSDKYVPTYSTQPEENVRRQLQNLHVDVNRPKVDELGNSEIAPPESGLVHQPLTTSGPPTSAVLPPPKMTAASVSGNPYAANKSTLQNKSKVMYHMSPLQSVGASEAAATYPLTRNEDTNPLHSSDTKASPLMYGIEPSSMDGARGNVSGDQDVNLETPPDNKERPDIVESEKSMSPMNLARGTASVIQEPNPRQWGQQAGYSISPENLEVAPRCGPDRNQYLETGQLSDDETSEVSQYHLSDASSWSGLQRMVPGQMNSNDSSSNQTDLQGSARQTFNEDVSTPPPGLHRMVPGQTEQDVADDGLSQTAVMLQRMVPGQMMDEDSANRNTATGEEIPPPGLRRMIPGESSSPESQVIGSSQPSQTFQPITAVPMEARVVTGVSREEVDGTDSQPTHGATVATSPSPTPDQPTTNKAQPTSERSETIGSDNIETYPPPATDNLAREGSSSTRRDNNSDRRHREEEQLDDRDTRRRGNHSGYRDREESPSGGRYEQGKRSHRSERDKHRHGEGDRTDERRRDRHETDSYQKKRRERDEKRDTDRAKERDRTDRPKSSRERGRHSESPEGRRYRDDRTHDRKCYDRDGYSSYHSNQDERRRYGRRQDYRDTDTGSEYSDYDRRDYDRRDYDRHGYDRKGHRAKSGYRARDDYGRYRDDDRRNRDSRGHHDRKKLDSQDRLYRDSQDHRPDIRDSQYPLPIPAFPGINPRSITDYTNYYSNYRAYDPAGYAEWYNNYYKSLTYQQPVSYSEDRGSVHSGRSSANSGRYRERELEQTTTSVTDDHVPMSPHRLTPSKYATAHIKATLTRKGHVVKILPHYPLDGQPGIVEIHDIQGFFASDEIKRDLISFPGPLVKGVTHKNSLIAFCNSKIKNAENSTDLFDRESVILLWKLLVLLLRQNGTVVGTDIAELLLSDHHVPVAPKRPSAGSSPALYASRESFSQDEQSVSHSNRSQFNIKSEEEITDTFREYLLYGNTKEALEWAMKNGLWGHALFLASKMDQRTYANVMTRFANGLTINDPLQTLYQLMSGRQPAAVTCCADEKWGDWRPHLAMILSNSSSQRVDLNYKAITTLGDTLGARGCLHAAHFTYVMAQVGFGTYAQKGSKIVLLGSSHHKSFEEFASNEAIQMTEIYEYANRLANSDFTIVTLQLYKLLYAKRLAEQGLISEAMLYAEELSNIVTRHPEHYTIDFVKDVYELGDSLKYIDPFYNCVGADMIEEDLPWLVKLKQLISDVNYGNSQETYQNYGSMTNVSYVEGDGYRASVDHLSQISEQQVQYDYNWQIQQPQQHVQTYSEPTEEQWLEQQQQQPEQQATQPTDQQTTDVSEARDSTQNQQAEWPNTPQSAHSTQNQQAEWPNTPQSVSQWWEAQGETVQQPQPEELPIPQITLPNSVPAKRERQDSDMEPKPSPKSTAKKKEAPKQAAGNGWFGGLWNKLALRPKNQMKLPDDKNPTIVWDSDRKCWTNLEEDGDDPAGNLPPPPKASSLMTNTNITSSQPQTSMSNHISGDHSQPNSIPPSTTTSGANMYKMNRGRNSRSNYVDVLGGNKASTQRLPPPPDIFPPVTQQPQSMNFFIPGAADVPTTSTSEYAAANSTTSDVLANNDTAGQETKPSEGYGTPLMYNPSEYSQAHPLHPSKLNNHYKNRYPQVK